MGSEEDWGPIPITGRFFCGLGDHGVEVPDGKLICWESPPLGGAPSGFRSLACRACLADHLGHDPEELADRAENAAIDAEVESPLALGHPGLDAWLRGGQPNHRRISVSVRADPVCAGALRYDVGLIIRRGRQGRPDDTVHARDDRLADAIGKALLLAKGREAARG